MIKDRIFKIQITMIIEDPLEGIKTNLIDLIQNLIILIQICQIQLLMDQVLVHKCKHNKVVMGNIIICIINQEAIMSIFSNNLINNLTNSIITNKGKVNNKTEAIVKIVKHTTIQT